MAKYTIYASEMAHYSFEIEAENIEQAYEKAYEQDFTQLEPIDYSGFQIDNAEEIVPHV